MMDVLEPSGSVERDIRVSATYQEHHHPVRSQLARQGACCEALLPLVVCCT
jgi:hypothetical protein